MLLPLLALYLVSQAGKGGGAPASSQPEWPTPRSPPPPLPAFTPNVPPVPADAAATATPLPALHKGAAPKPPKPKAAPSMPSIPTPGGALTQARQAGKHAASSATKAASRKLKSLNPFASSSGLTSKTVHELQGIVNAHGGSLTQDGLWGPKTAAAWQTLANSQGLPPDITRNGPHTARVSPHTFDVLRVPPIP